MEGEYHPSGLLTLSGPFGLGRGVGLFSFNPASKYWSTQASLLDQNSGKSQLQPDARAEPSLPQSRAAPTDGYKVIAKYPHSIDSYTEGFLYLNGMFYEGTGINGRSALLAIDPQTGRVLPHRDLPAEYFKMSRQLQGEFSVDLPSRHAAVNTAAHSFQPPAQGVTCAPQFSTPGR